MRTIFTMGFRPAASFQGPGGRQALGQFDWGTLVTSLLTTGAKAGLEYYSAEQQIKEIKKSREQAQAQAAAAQKQAEEAKKQEQAALQPPPGAAAARGGAPSATILGIDKTTFYIGAGVLGVGAIVVTLIATR